MVFKKGNKFCFKKGQSPWNKGLTINDPRVKKYAEKAAKTKIGKLSHRKGKTMLEEYGLEKRNEICKKKSEKLIGKKRLYYREENHPRWTGKNNSLIAKRTLEKVYGIFWEDMFLPENPVIHHINSNRADNQFENLCVMSRGDHNRVHFCKEHNNGN